MVGIHVIGHRRQGCVGRVCLVGREHGDGLVSQPDVFEQGIAVLVILAQQMAALVIDKQLRRCGSGVHFAYALTCVVVGVIGGAAGECNARQSPPQVVRQREVVVRQDVASRVVGQADGRHGNRRDLVACRINGVGPRRAAIDGGAGAVSVGVVRERPGRWRRVGLRQVSQAVIAELLVQVRHRDCRAPADAALVMGVTGDPPGSVIAHISEVSAQRIAHLPAVRVKHAGVTQRPTGHVPVPAQRLTKGCEHHVGHQGDRRGAGSRRQAHAGRIALGVTDAHDPSGRIGDAGDMPRRVVGIGHALNDGRAVASGDRPQRLGGTQHPSQRVVGIACAALGEAGRGQPSNAVSEPAARLVIGPLVNL